MNTTITSLTVLACLFGAALLGMALRRILPEHHFSSETKDTVKVAMGFVATMAALILGLLVASAKDSFDQQATGVTQMAAKVVYLDRLLASMGPETNEVRALYRRVVDDVMQQMWPDTISGQSQLDPTATHSESLFAAIQALKTENDLQSALKTQAAATSLELGQMRWLEYEQAGGTASMPVLCILVFWLAVLFASFGMFAPSNGTAVAALLLSALSAAGAICLMLELRSPFSGLMQIPSAPFSDAIAHLRK